VAGSTRLTEAKRRELETGEKDDYRQVRALVSKDDGRMQAYGWSLPTAGPSSSYTSAPTAMYSDKEGGSTSGVGGKNRMPVPVPVYCKPMTHASVADNTAKVRSRAIF